MSEHLSFVVFSQDEEGKVAGVSRRISSICKKSPGVPQGTRLSLKQTRKELMSALIRAGPSSGGESRSPRRSSPGVCGAAHTWGRGGLTQLQSGAPVSKICLSSSFLLLTKRLWLNIRLRQSIPLQRAGWPTSMLCIVELLIKCMQA